jgi:very-short-patch-repair endonuclease
VEQLGYEVHPQVGIAGFFIDLAVLDRERKGRYLVGIECDGASYHSSRSARDRDRLRQSVLEDHGWIIHRIWSTDWFQRPKEQLRKLVDAIEKAKVVLKEVSESERPQRNATPTIDPDEGFERESALHVETKAFSSLSVPYRQASLEVPRRIDPHELPLKEMADILFKIVQREGPIHEDELAVRVRDIWGLGRAGSRIQDAVARGARSLIVSRRCTRKDGFLSIPGEKILVRNREHASSPTLRRPEMLPPAEICAAILALIDANHGAWRRELPSAVARLFGFKNTSNQLRERIDLQLGVLVRDAVLEDSDGMLKRRH